MADPLHPRARRHPERQEPVQPGADDRGSPGTARRRSSPPPGAAIPRWSDGSPGTRQSRPASWPTVDVGTDLAGAIEGAARRAPDPRRGPDPVAQRGRRAMTSTTLTRSSTGRSPTALEAIGAPSRPGGGGLRRDRSRHGPDACRVTDVPRPRRARPPAVRRRRRHGPPGGRRVCRSPSSRPRRGVTERDDRACARGAQSIAIGPLDDAAMAEARRRSRPADQATGQPRASRGARDHDGRDHRPPGCAGAARRRSSWSAADHGVTRQGVSAYPSAVTAQMVANFVAAGRRSTSWPTRSARRSPSSTSGSHPRIPRRPPRPAPRRAPGPGADPRGTADMTTGPAMARRRSAPRDRRRYRACRRRCRARRRLDVLAVGEMGIGNTTAASAVDGGPDRRERRPASPGAARASTTRRPGAQGRRRSIAPWR